MIPSDLTENEKEIFDFAKENPPPNFKEKSPPWEPLPWVDLTQQGKRDAMTCARSLVNGAYSPRSFGAKIDDETTWGSEIRRAHVICFKYARGRTLYRVAIYEDGTVLDCGFKGHIDAL